jgi:hypothetical protein
MTTDSPTVEDRRAKPGIHLPDAPTPLGAYVPAVQTGNRLFSSEMLATSGDQNISGALEPTALNCGEMNYPAASYGVSKAQHVNDSESRHPRTLLSGVQFRIRLDSR